MNTRQDIDRANVAGCQAVVWVILAAAVLILIILGAMLP